MKAIRALETLPRNILRSLPANTSIHGLLSAHLSVDTSAGVAAWKAVFPTLTEFEAGMPLMWPEELQDLLPLQVKHHLEKQQARFERDWDLFAKAYPHIPEREYLYFWLLINTRTFYNETEKTEKYPWEDRLALLPVADLFNHSADEGCCMAFYSKGYAVTVDKAYNAGDEVFISYGDHPNDYILTEYGFIIDDNQWDKIYLDDVLIPKLSGNQKSELQRKGIFGEYLLGAGKKLPSRTQNVLRLLCLSGAQSQRLTDVKGAGGGLQEQVDALFTDVLIEFLDVISDTLEHVEKLKVGQTAQRALLARRWKQISNSITRALRSRGQSTAR